MFALTRADRPAFLCLPGLMALRLALLRRLVLPPTHAVLRPLPSCSTSPSLPWKNLPSEIFWRVSVGSSQPIVPCLRRTAEIIQLRVKSSLLLHVPTARCIKLFDDERYRQHERGVFGVAAEEGGILSTRQSSRIQTLLLPFSG